MNDVDTSSVAAPVERVVKFPSAAIRSIKSLMCEFRATCHVCPEPQRSARHLPHPLQGTVRGLYHQSPDVTVKPGLSSCPPTPPYLLSPVTVSGIGHPFLAITSRVQNISPSGQWWQALPHMLRCFFHSLAFWVAEQLTKCPQETVGHMVWGKVPHKAIKPFGLWHRGASVRDDGYLLVALQRSVGWTSQTADVSWLQHTVLTWNYFFATHKLMPQPFTEPRFDLVHHGLCTFYTFTCFAALQN